jgi:lambda family phage minor tail protein L
VELFHLFELDVTPIGGEIYYFHEYNSDPVVFNGKTYIPIPIETDGFEITSKGLPTPTIKVGNVLGFIGTLVRTFDGLQGAKVTRHKIKKNTPGYTYSVTDSIGLADIYIVDRPTAHSSISISFELKSVFDFSGQKVPKRTLLISCPLVYGGAECGVPITSEFPTCPRNVSACRDREGGRLGQGNPELPYGGFPGINGFSNN